MKKPILIFISILLFLPNLFHCGISPVLSYNKIERYDPSLAYLNSIDKLEKHIDSTAAQQSAVPGTLAYTEIAAYTLRDRFYHGYSNFALSENWIAALCGKYIWQDLSCKVMPEEIVKYNYAACSQQEVVLMAILRDKHTTYRSVLFPHHYTLEALLNNKWYFFDTNMEPSITGEARWSENWHNNADSLKRYYDTTRFKPKDLDFTFGINHPIIYGKVNEIPAPHERLFQIVTEILSKIAWIFPLLLLFYLDKKDRNTKTEKNI